jgi:hypothetical protein
MMKRVWKFYLATDHERPLFTNCFSFVTASGHLNKYKEPGILPSTVPRMLDTLAPGQIGTRTLQHLCETFWYQDKSAPGQFGTPIRQIGTSKRQIGTFFNHVCSGKDPDHANNTVTLYATVVWHCEIERSLKLMWFLTATFSMRNCALKKNVY